MKSWGNYKNIFFYFFQKCVLYLIYIKSTKKICTLKDNFIFIILLKIIYNDFFKNLYY